MMNLKKIFILCSVLALCSCKSSLTTEVKEIPQKKPKNVILLIADGTGLSQISSAYYYKKSQPNYSRFENIGLIQTSSSRQDITDSAAGATAFACGVKTYNGAIGVSDDSTDVKTIIELVSPKGIKTGVISTSSIVHATPASFYAHAYYRGYYEEIAEDLVASDVDFVAGGGTKFFNARKDGRNLFKDLEAKTFKIDTSELSTIETLKNTSKAAFIIGKEHLPPVSKGRGNYLSNATELGIQFLTNDNRHPNFFLMVEGSQVDWGGHANDAEYLISELIDFDSTLGKALDFAERDGNTLVIVTANHETGGFTLSSKTKTQEDGSSYSDYAEINPTFSTGGHSATLIPVFAYGPGSEAFRGVYQNNDIFHKIMEVTGWGKN